MPKSIFRYDFDAAIEIAEVEATILLAIIATEALHGETAAQLGISHFLDATKRACVIDASSKIGADFNTIFLGFLRREFGPHNFKARRVTAPDASPAVAA